MLSERYQNFAEFAVLISRCGIPTVEHVPSRSLIHSRVDPLRESEDAADVLRVPKGRDVVLVGGGLGYLAEAIAKRVSAARVFVIEPFPELWFLARESRGDSAYICGDGMEVVVSGSMDKLGTRIANLPANAVLIASPYVVRLARNSCSPLASFLSILRTESASQEHYTDLIAEHEMLNAEIIGALPNALGCFLTSEMIVVTGAGPSLEFALPVLQEFRSSVSIVAVSGAVPALLQSDVIPDWVIALEARESIWRDVQNLPPSCNLVVFPATDPRVVRAFKERAFSGIAGAKHSLHTRGGSTIIPALDFALRCSRSPVAIVGVDLSNRNGTYARGAMRTAMSAQAEPREPLKFVAMRAGMENILRQHRGRVIYHVLERGTILQGTERLLPLDWKRLMSDTKTTVAKELHYVG